MFHIIKLYQCLSALQQNPISNLKITLHSQNQKLYSICSHNGLAPLRVICLIMRLSVNPQQNSKRYTSCSCRNQVLLVFTPTSIPLAYMCRYVYMHMSTYLVCRLRLWRMKSKSSQMLQLRVLHSTKL